jgi:purine-nucleoside phosphorylase
VPEIAIILGTGLGALAERIEVETVIPYEEIPRFPLSTVESHTRAAPLRHAGGEAGGGDAGPLPPLRGVHAAAGDLPGAGDAGARAKTLVVSNACGGMNPLWAPGDLVLIADHINLLGDNPLIGPNDDALGPRFPDMSEPYDPALRDLARQVALELKIPLRSGVYVAVPGPNLETRAEYRMLRMMGADVVGMSTVPEVIVAVHGGMRVLGISIITDACLPDALEVADITRIIAAARARSPT